MELRITEASDTKLAIRFFDCVTIELTDLSRYIWKSVQEKSDNRRYFEANIESCLDRLYGAALRLTKNASDAEDLVAETVTRGLKKIDTLKDCDRMIYWLLRIMSNHFISECRKTEKKTGHETYIEEPEDDAPFSLFERLHQPFLLWWGTPEQDFLNNTLSSDITKAIESLDTRYRIVVILSDIEGMTYQDIADTIEVPVGTVRSRLARGRSHLQKALWHHGKDRDLTEEKKTTRGSSS
jgi:RNA polymerase sigma-70 factor (ECF subfamily)